MHQIRRKVKKDVTSEQTKKMLILRDSIVKYGSEYNLSHSLENCNFDVQNFTVTRIKCRQGLRQIFSQGKPAGPHFLFVKTIYQQIKNRSNLKFNY